MNIVLMNLSKEFLSGELQTFFLARGLQESSEHSIVLICRDGSKLQALARQHDIEVFSLASGLLGRALGRLKLRWFFRRNPGRWIVHTHDNISAALGADLSRKHTDLRLIHSRHTPERISDGKLQDKIRAGLLVACETQEIAFIMAEAKIMPRSLKIIHGGIDASGYPKRTNRGNGRIIFGCGGRLEPGNGHETLIRALPFFQKLAESSAACPPAWEVRLSGSGPLFEPLLELAKELGVESRLAFLGGQDSKVVFPDCDLLVAPAESGEGCSLALMEGWAVGLPIICSDSMAHQETAVNLRDALWFANGNAEDLAEKMWSLIADATLQNKLMAGGKEALQSFSHTAMTGRYLECYERLLAINFI
ncbi:MAG: glycosyltransferase family 4 protein [Deltaproteobacteria bacterium]|jgi:glycosyltransferase involved in cell wall biosynthesis|nr:glycosyltransferase family 4 protein [Deltaproteobacteria bacterium]